MNSIISAPVIYGYSRFPLVGNRRAALVHDMHATAGELGGPLRGVYWEAPSPAGVLWSLLETLDRRLGGQVVSTLTEFAQAEGVDIRDVVAAGLPAMSRWRALVDELSRFPDSWIIMPSPRDLDALGEPRRTVLQRLSSMRVGVSYLYRPSGSPTPPRRPPTRRPSAPDIDSELGKIRIRAYGLPVEKAKISTAFYLSRAGLGYMVDTVNKLLVELVGERVEDTLIPGRTNEIVVVFRRRRNSLVVQIQETHDHTDEPVNDTAYALCGRDRVHRAGTADGGTVTSCELLLSDDGTTRLADGVRRYQALSAVADKDRA